ILGDPGNYSGATEGTWHGRRDSVRHADCWFVADHHGILGPAGSCRRGQQRGAMGGRRSFGGLVGKSSFATGRRKGTQLNGTSSWRASVCPYAERGALLLSGLH